MSAAFPDTESHHPPLKVLELLDTTLDTIEKVEVAWQLFDAGRPLTRSELLERCQSPPVILNASLADLTRSEIVRTDPSSGSFALGRLAREPPFDVLMELYGRDRLIVISILATNALERIRSMAVRTFSERLASGQRKRSDGDDT